MPKLSIKGPVVQCAIDVLTIEGALKIADAAVKGGVDWLEVGTPLVTFAGTAAIGALSREFPQMPVLADYKMMDGTRKYVLETRQQGGHVATICAQASDASHRTAIAAGQETEIVVVSDLYNTPDPAARAAEVEALGVDSVMVHWGADQRNEQPQADALRQLPAVVERVKVPVGVAVFSIEDGVRAVKQGASILVMGVPLILAENVESAFREFVDRVKSAGP